MQQVCIGRRVEARSGRGQMKGWRRKRRGGVGEKRRGGVGEGRGGVV
jgi:hypothetical protein